MATTVSVDDLDDGAHACLTFSDPEERLDIVAAFVRRGLDSGQKVMCFTDAHPTEALGHELAERGAAPDGAMLRGQLLLQRSDEAYLAGGAFAPESMIDVLAREVSRARDEGYAGLRVTADMGWVTRPFAGIDQVADFEAEMNKLFVDGRLTAICQYDRDSFDPVTLAIATRVHPHAVAALIYHEDPVLRICRQHRPPGIRLAGEMDFTYGEAFHKALAEALRLDHDPCVNLTKLSFIDVASATTLLQAALSLPEDRTLTVACRGLIGRVLHQVGLADVPQLRMVITDDRS